MIRALLALSLVAACGGRITDESDASDSSTDSHSSFDSSESDGGGGGDAMVITCGPNTCKTDEICCSEKCGVCAFANECVVHDCGGP